MKSQDEEYQRDREEMYSKKDKSRGAKGHSASRTLVESFHGVQRRGRVSSATHFVP